MTTPPPTPARLRILHLDSGREWRGGQRQSFLLSRALRDRGHEPLIAAHPGAPLLERAHAAGLATAAITMRGEWDIAAARRIRTLVRVWRPHVVHAHDARAHAVALLALAGGGGTTPLVVTRRVAFAPRAVRTKYGPRVARFIAISAAVHDAMVRAGVAPSRVELVYSGVPAPAVTLRRAWRAELGWPPDSVICGVVGAMTREKGIEALAAIGTHISPTVAERVRVVLLGGERLGRVQIGPVEGFAAGFLTDVYDAMAGVDILWHPSTSEGFGTTLLDAMALAVPPVTFQVGGVGEVVTDAEGILVAPGDLRAFARATERLVLDAALRQRLGASGVARAAQFSVDRMTDGALAVYHKVREG